jgi:hypothetical protein
VPSERDLVHAVPSWVGRADRVRWILAEDCARQLFSDDPGAIWAATRALFRSNISTFPEEGS